MFLYKLGDTIGVNEQELLNALIQIFCSFTKEKGLYCRIILRTKFLMELSARRKRLSQLTIFCEPVLMFHGQTWESLPWGYDALAPVK